MRFVIATDGRLAAEAAALVDRLAAADDSIELVTVVTVPRRLVKSMRPKVEPSDSLVGHAAGHLGVTGHAGADAMAVDSSTHDWAGDHEVIGGYVDERAREAQQPLVAAFTDRGREVSSISLAGERVVPAILAHLDASACGMLIVGQHRGVLPGYLGHTPQRLVSEAPCPVLVVPVD